MSILRYSSAFVIGICLGIIVPMQYVFRQNEMVPVVYQSQPKSTYMDRVRETSSLQSSVDCTKISRQQDVDVDKMIPVSHDDIFPYKKFDSFAMDWNGIVEEFELMYSNLKRNGTGKHWIFDKQGPGSFGLFSISKSKCVNFFIMSKHLSTILTEVITLVLEAATLEKIDMDTIKGTLLYLFSEAQSIKRGGFIHVVVESYDGYGNKRLRGGDFLQAVMSNDRFKQRTAGRIFDYLNGTYSIYFFAGWQGDATITVKMYTAREAILFLNNMYSSSGQHLQWTGYFSDGNTTQSSICNVIYQDIWEEKCEFVNPLSLGSTAFVCDKPDNLSCNTIYDTGHNVIDMDEKTAEEITGKQYLFKIAQNDQPIDHPIDVKISDSDVQLKLPSCGPDLPIPLSNGYWSDNLTFVPLMCQSQQWTPDDAVTCLSGKHLHFYGGSSLQSNLKVLKPFLGDHLNAQANVLFHGQFVALRMGIINQTLRGNPFEADYIDKIECTTHTPVLVMNFCFHFGSWPSRAYLDRLFAAKLALVRLTKRCPNSIILFKLSHPRSKATLQQSVHSANYRFYDMNRMARRVLGGIGIRFLDVWDLVLSHSHENDIHPPSFIVQQQIHLMLSFICPHMVKQK
ncbi:NXPE family member 3-like [Glandiceps talaboti]